MTIKEKLEQRELLIINTIRENKQVIFDFILKNLMDEISYKGIIKPHDIYYAELKPVYQEILRNIDPKYYYSADSISNNLVEKYTIQLQEDLLKEGIDISINIPPSFAINMEKRFVVKIINRNGDK